MRATAARNVMVAALIIVVVAAIVIGAILAFQPGRFRAAATREFTIVGGEVKGQTELLIGGFALLGEEITSPGPTIRVKKGDRVKITFKNVHGYARGLKIAHNFLVVAEKEGFDPKPLWGAKIGERVYPNEIEAGESGSVTFTPDRAGKFFYICAVGGHHLYNGMYGSFIVEE